MKKHEALIRQAEISKAREGAFSFGVFVGIIIGVASGLLAIWLAMP